MHLFCTVVLVGIGQNWGDCNISRTFRMPVTSRGEEKTRVPLEFKGKMKKYGGIVVNVLHAELYLFHRPAAADSPAAMHVHLDLLISGKILRPTTTVVVAG